MSSKLNDKELELIYDYCQKRVLEMSVEELQEAVKEELYDFYSNWTREELINSEFFNRKELNK